VVVEVVPNVICGGDLDLEDSRYGDVNAIRAIVEGHPLGWLAGRVRTVRCWDTNHRNDLLGDVL